MAAWFPDMFCNFYRVKNHSTTSEARVKISTDFKYLELQKISDVFSCNWVLNKVDTDKSSLILISFIPQYV
jgi:hypothetical protein